MYLALEQVFLDPYVPLIIVLAAIYGVFMIALMYLMPMGAAGFVRMAGAWVVRKWGVRPASAGPDT